MTMRFLPWTRRGLASTIATTETHGALPARAQFPVSVRVASDTGGEVSAGADVALYGPGDITGIDTRVIVRTDPKRHAGNVAPDSFVAAEFDNPEFPWMFTPAAPDGDNRLRPWLVLIVVEKTDGVSIVTNEALPLPQLTIEAPAVPADQLPDLTESWAWAHTQVITESAGDDLMTSLDSDPDRNVSRLMCPRRLRPDAPHIAALVPAFDQGVAAGLGRGVDPAASLQNAWALGSMADSIQLPLYYHWEFTTGPAGDFEYLARQLEPMTVPDGVGRTPMFIGDAHSAIGSLAPDSGGIVQMQGALRAPDDPASTETVDAGFVADLIEVVDAANAQASGGASTEAEAVAPPIYASWPTKTHAVPAQNGRPRWLRDLNADPKHRTAAGLGAEVVRANQEEYVDAAWRQVGDVMKANEAMRISQLIRIVASRIHQRHVLPLDHVGLVSLTALAHHRLPIDGAVLRHTIEQSAAPTALAAPALRRAASPQSARLKFTARIFDLPTDPSANVTTGATLAAAADGSWAPTLEAVPAGLLEATTTLSLLDGDLGASLPADIRAEADQLRLDYVDLQATFDDSPWTFEIRTDLGSVGLVLDRHVDALRDSASIITRVDDALDVLQGAELDLHAATLTPQPLVGFAVSPEAALAPLTLDLSGRITALTVDQPRPMLEIDPSIVSEVTSTTVRDLIPEIGGASAPTRPDRAALRASTVGLRRVESRRGRGAGPVVNRPSPAQPSTPIITIDPLITDAESIGAFVQAVDDHWTPVATLVPPVAPPPTLDLVSVGTAVATATNPVPFIEARAGTRLRIGGAAISQLGLAAPTLDLSDRLDIWQRTPVDRIMVGPRLRQPLYRDLARYDQERFLPGAGDIPDNALTVVVTNPAFVEAFMVGANHEFNRELLWRRYPTDRRGTAFRTFWDHLDGGTDIEAIHTWSTNTRLGSNGTVDADGSIVLVVRGQLLRRYPNTVIYAAEATADRRIDPNGDALLPVFSGRLDPDLSFVGFDLSVEEATSGNGWLFVLQEQPSEPRFGLDIPDGPVSGVPGAWADLTWGHVDADPGDHLLLSSLPSASRPLIADTPAITARFGTNSAHMAAITFQRPFRAAVHTSEVLEENP